MAGLGGVSTIPDVCFECNQRLGKEVDEEFLRKSPLAFRRLVDPDVSEGEAPSPQFTKSDFGYLDVRLFNNGTMLCLPQILLAGDRVRIGAAPAEQARILEVFEQIRTEGEACLRVHLLDVDEHSPARVIAGRKDKHLLRARTRHEADQLLHVIATVKLSGEYQEADIKPDISLRISMDVNAPGRCAAKMAFNAATYIFGAGVMVRDDYDPVRNYILGKDVQQGPVTTENGEEGLLVDRRFVSDPFEPGEAIRGNAHYHPLHLGPRAGQLCCLLHVFGGAIPFFVRLGPLPENAKARLPVALMSLKEGGEIWFHLGTMRHWRHNGTPPWAALRPKGTLPDEVC